MHKRSHEPIFWTLFGAGGVLAALLLPVLVFVTGLAVPLGVLPSRAFTPERISAVAGSLPGAVALTVIISLLLWHAMHRINHSLHDLGIKAGRTGKFVCYGVAMAATLASGFFATALLLNS